jgi:hypothetical protein
VIRQCPKEAIVTLGSWKRDRYDNYRHWLRRIPRNVENLINLTMENGHTSVARKLQPSLQMWTTQRDLEPARLRRLIKKFDEYDHARRPTNMDSRLPVILKAFGRYIIWDGNHRITSAALLGRPLWVYVIDLDDQMRDRDRYWKEKKKTKPQKAATRRKVF